MTNADFVTKHHWHGVMTGPVSYWYHLKRPMNTPNTNPQVGSPYEHGIYRLNIRLVEDYPHTPPQVKFETLIYHPNISIDGILAKSFMARIWNERYTVRSCMLE